MQIVSRYAWGVYREREAPVPIPNTEVKPLFGNDTARDTAWESSTMPHLKYAQVTGWLPGLFFVFNVS